jgi:putative DNA primase/helicase
VTAPEGERNDRLNKAAFSLGQIIAGGGLDRDIVEAALLTAATTAGLPETEARRTIQSGLAAGMKEPRAAPESGPTDNSRQKAAPKERPAGPIVLRASSVTIRQVEWLWPGRIPLGKLTTFAGNGGLGKTFVLCDLAARVTRGEEWPATGGEVGDPGQVVFISGEDEPDDTLVPRMLQLNADLDRITFLRPEVADRFTLADLDTLEAAVEQTGPGVRLVAIDPPTAYLGDVNDHSNAELRGLLSPLKSWAARHHLSVVFNTHVTKPQGAKVEAMQRVMGSVAWVNAVRAAHMFAKDPDKPDTRRLFVPMKNNLGPPLKGLAYELNGGSLTELPRLDWLGEVDTTADEAVAGDKPQSREEKASDWLAARFREKLEWPSEELFAAAKAAGVSRNAIFEAKETLKLRHCKKVHACWVWWVPADWPRLREGMEEIKP